AHAYASLLNLCGRVDWQQTPKPWQQALQLLGAARRDSVVDAFCANELINVCAKALRWQHALALLNELFGAEQLQQNIVSFNAVLDAARTARAWRLALRQRGWRAWCSSLKCGAMLRKASGAAGCGSTGGRYRKSRLRPGGLLLG
ncbi:unnamed protein product, partial [Symbiodinium necroappetens]